MASSDAEWPRVAKASQVDLYLISLQLFSRIFGSSIINKLSSSQTLFQSSHFVFEIYQPPKNAQNQFCLKNLSLDLCFWQKQARIKQELRSFMQSQDLVSKLKYLMF